MNRVGLGWFGMRGRLVIAVAAASFGACSAWDDTAVAPDEPPQPVDSDVSLEEKAAMELTADERGRLDAYFAANGLPEEAVTYNGRVLTYEGDMMMDADYFLNVIDERVDKGFAHQFSSNNVDLLSRCTGAQVAPSECAQGQYQFFRPYIDGRYHVIVNSNIQYNFDLVLTAANRVENIVGDKPDNVLFNVIKASDFANLDPIQRIGYKINVNINSSSVPCGSPTTQKACMELPRITTEQDTPLTVSTRMRLGRTMHIRGDLILENNEANRGEITHQFLHALGIGHMFFEGGLPAKFKLYVPGTLKPVGSSPPSLMWNFVDPARTTVPSADDIDMMQTLFPPGVTYIHAFSTVNAN